jgi:hypothetical protein
LEFIRKLEKENLVQARKTERGYLVEMLEAEGSKEAPPETVEPASEAISQPAVPAAPAAVAELAPSPSLEVAPESGLNAEETLALLKRALSSLTEKGPSRPIYLRQVRQAMRNADARFDERQAGFRGLLDLLHQAQREGWLRLHRDRKGVWRVFTTSMEAVPTPVTPEAVPELAIEPEVETAPPEADVLWEAVEIPEETTMIEPPETPPPPSEPPAPEEPAPEKRPRKVRPAKRPPRRSQHKATSRRKPKETVQS